VIAVNVNGNGAPQRAQAQTGGARRALTDWRACGRLVAVGQGGVRRERHEALGSGQQRTPSGSRELALMGRSPNVFGPRQTRGLFRGGAGRR
jgi:hypothetical protein